MTHKENKEDFEDGEIPEDGEICDDEDPMMKSTSPLPPQQIPTAHVTAPAVREPRRRFEQASPPREREREPRERDPDPFGSHNEVPDGNNEFYGDKDYRNNGGGATAASSEEEPFADQDYRINRRRRLSPTHDDSEYESRSKRPFYPGRGGGGDRGGFRGGFRNGGKPRFNTEHQICKFFREGYCRDGDKCSYSHQAEDSLRRPQLCNFYANSFCKKGLQCLMLHGEFPCKAFHRGQCHNDNCRYSHVPLTEYTRPLIEKFLTPAVPEEQDPSRQPQHPPVYRQNPVANAAAAAAAAQVMAPRRRVLLPGVSGPQPNGTSPPHAAAPVIHAPVPTAAHPSQLPPPAVVVPTIQRNGPGPGGYAQQGGYFNAAPSRPEQVQGLPPPRTIEPPRLSQPRQMQHLQQPGLVMPPQVVSHHPVKQEPEPPAFNLEDMLNKLANSGKLKQSSPKVEPAPIDDSPASPPPFSTNMFGMNKQRVTVIPQHVQVIWGLVRVQRRLPYSNVDNAEKINSADPRRAKAISKQFDAFSTIIGATGTGGVSDPRLRAKAEADAKADKAAFASWMPRMA